MWLLSCMMTSSVRAWSISHCPTCLTTPWVHDARPTTKQAPAATRQSNQLRQKKLVAVGGYAAPATVSVTMTAVRNGGIRDGGMEELVRPEEGHSAGARW
jgi:hypothetical protein